MKSESHFVQSQLHSPQVVNAILRSRSQSELVTSPDPSAAVASSQVVVVSAEKPCESTPIDDVCASPPRIGTDGTNYASPVLSASSDSDSDANPLPGFVFSGASGGIFRPASCSWLLSNDHDFLVCSVQCHHQRNLKKRLRRWRKLGQL